MRILAAVSVALWLSATLSFGQEVAVDPAHSSVNFTIKHLSISNVKGAFNEFSGDWKFDPATKLLTALNGTVKVTSVDTNSDARDKHLRNADFFDVAQFPEMKFRLLKHVVRDGNGRVIGELTLRGVTKPVEWSVTVSDIVPNPMDNGKTRKQGVSLSGEVNRKDFGLGAKYPDAVLAEKVQVSIELEGNLGAN